MKHFVAISLVFFSLTQLAKVERAEGLRLLAEGYCNQQQISSQKFTLAADSSNEDQASYFLSSGELALIGALSELKSTKYDLQDQHVSDLIVVGEPQNNSP
ncbi:MAG: hypothetical protein EOO90_15050 [Pedobacter sp.]|nr:MAG: hypothetical protein EOO90_15050 [Pedobacter sp.]